MPPQSCRLAAKKTIVSVFENFEPLHHRLESISVAPGGSTGHLIDLITYYAPVWKPAAANFKVQLIETVITSENRNTCGFSGTDQRMPWGLVCCENRKTRLIFILSIHVCGFKQVYHRHMPHGRCPHQRCPTVSVPGFRVCSVVEQFLDYICVAL